MINYKKVIILGSFIILFLLTSCTTVEEQVSRQVKHDITKGSNYKGFVQKGGRYIEFENFSTEHINYNFETEKYTSEQISVFINKFEIIRDFLQNKCKVSFDEHLSIYVSDKNTFDGRDKKVFINNINMEFKDMTVAILQSLYGNTSNYGLCYGIACYINENIYNDEITQDISTKELGQYYSTNENIILMDLTIPVFQDIYFSKEQNKYAYAATYYFVKDLIERKGIEYSVDLLRISAELNLDFDVKYTNEKNIWLKSIGATGNCDTPAAPIRYELTLDELLSKVYPYMIYTPSIKAHIVPNMADLEFSWNEVIMDYDNFKQCLIMYEQDVSALKKYLSSYFDTNKDIIDCYFKDVIEENDKNYYSYLDKKIVYISPFSSGVHEYSHYLTIPNMNAKNTPIWLREGIAVYCDSYLESKGVYRLKETLNGSDNYVNNRLYDKNFPNKDASRIKFYREYIACFAIRGKHAAYSLAKLNNIDEKEQEGLELTYPEVGSLTNYLIETYGIEKYFKLFEDYSKLNEIYGKSFETLKGEWKKKLNNSLSFEYIIGSDGLKIEFLDVSEAHIPSKRSFVEILGGNTYEYVDCGLGRNKDDDTNPDANDFEGLNLNDKIALIKQIKKEGVEIENFSKQINNAVKEGAIGVIMYSENGFGFSGIILKGITEDVPVIIIPIKDGEILKNSKEKKVTVDKDFFGVIDYDF